MNLAVYMELTLFILVLGDLEDEEGAKVLSPVDLANLVLKQDEFNDLRWRFSTKDPNLFSSSLLTTELNEEARLRSRKVWSRWGKWSECSVTCGSGVRSRQRVCLEGRCAPGESECQRRPCARSPCDAQRPLAERAEPHDME